MDNLQDYFKVKEAATFLGVSESTLRNWERNGKIESHRHPLNGYRLFRRSDLATFLAQMKSPAEASPEAEPATSGPGRKSPQPTLVLDSLEIRNFGTFEHLSVERLGRVNLIVGKNNVGKSSLLEAIRLYVLQGREDVMWDILRARDESEIYPSATVGGLDEVVSVIAVNRLINQHHEFDVGSEGIRIGPASGKGKALSIRLEMTRTLQDNRSATGSGSTESLGKIGGPSEALALVTRMGSDAVGSKLWDDLHDPQYWRSFRRARRLGDDTQSCSYLRARELSREEVASWWDRIVLTDLESDVLEGLRILEPAVERLQFVQRSLGVRVPLVKLRGQDRPVPLASLGDGMNRVLAILLALAVAKNGTLLIDEVENGIHYSVLGDLWRLILIVAERINAQVFTTTHSWDCIEAFQSATAAVPGQQGYLIRLARRDVGISAVIFDERKLAIATRQDIEVR